MEGFNIARGGIAGDATVKSDSELMPPVSGQNLKPHKKKLRGRVSSVFWVSPESSDSLFKQ
jgi:hypothetical protein